MKNTTDIASVGAGELVNIFADRELDALMTALNNAARSAGCVHISGVLIVYDYLAYATKSALVSDLVDELHRLGYKIEPNTRTAPTE